MEVEVGLKLTKTTGDFTSADLRIAKDRAGPLFESKETDSMFILTLHLKGYEKENVKIDINEDETQITVNGEKPVQEIVMVGWRVCKQEIAMRRFRRGFKIPDGVVVDKINAWFNKEESILTIKMPKWVKGFRGIRVEEAKEEEEVDRANGVVDNERIETSPIPQEGGKKPDIEGVKGSDDQAAEEKEQTTEKESQEAVAESKKLKERELEERNRITETVESAKNVPDQMGKNQVEEQAADEIARLEGEIQGQESGKQDKPQELHGDETSRRKQLEDKEGREVKGKEGVSGDEEARHSESPEREEERSHVNRVNETSSEICGPVIIGSAFLVSVIVFVIHLFRTRNPPTKRKS